MKKLTQKISLSVFTLLIFATIVFGQTTNASSDEKPESPYDKMNIKFVLDGTPTPEELGFDNPKSYWQFSYELRFLTKDLMNYKPFTEIPNESTAERTKRIKKNNKQHDKAWKKSSILVVKGKVPKTQLLSPINREIIIPIPLSAEIKEVLANAADTWENPAFRIKLTGKVFTQSKSNLKFKEKLTSAIACFTKVIDKDKNAQYWLTNTCGIYLGLIKENNKIRVVRTSRL